MDYFTPEQMYELVERLRMLTAKNRLVWHSVSNNDFAFAATASRTGFVIASRDNDDLAPHVLEVHQMQPEIKKLQAADSSDYSPHFGSELEMLYDAVKRKVLKIDVVATQVLDELDQLDG